ncbi:MAG: hypothetical protein BAA02_08930 [Paenibacillaceae bacterium ZCTH02-B3]|nr:MAG: hypothetical protein BAA02_08930 [Paenibacillaceae bacterium ZCTH02-B3]
MPRLSRRLAALAEWVPEGARFADIGTDHALLPVYLALSGRIASAVAGDLRTGPVRAALRQVEAAGAGGVVSVRQGDGLSVLAPGEADTLCIAGLGGAQIVRILETGGPRLAGVRTLLLAPQRAEGAVRRWLSEHGWVLDAERLVEEGGVIYTLLKAVKPADGAEAERRNRGLYDPEVLAPRMPEIPLWLLYDMGPLLLRRPDAAFRRLWEAEAAKRERVVRQLERSASPEAARKAEILEREARLIREVLGCLPAET